MSPSIYQTLPGIRYFLAENIRSARRYFSRLKVFESIEALDFAVLDKDTGEKDLAALMRPLMEGNDMGVISESGCPGVADPGALAVRYAHRFQKKVVPLVGPSSVLLALMASGLNGQQFVFHGYLPVGNDLGRTIRACEKDSRLKVQTQVFIETPYRNNAVFQALVNHLSPETSLCVAFDITGPDELIITRRVTEWRVSAMQWPKKPAVFLFLA